ncbi:EpsG family protein [Acinetobacter baumannii]|uniref:EpsG family protein n=1 Tax=Acinetobacter baumannii TaxID=470 RepID=UPI0024B74C00|nr:EpsG family protein [Acinetobacter baumannii]MDI9760074.1 EpsG family protein [Acinetobacter baumannii]MDO3668705.1 EpsG family protein [Acinetobacter baumannii]WNV59974.1 Wzy oligosaccharide-unit polymerase [Acinetobacter baumannii]
MIYYLIYFYSLTLGFFNINFKVNKKITIFFEVSFFALLVFIAGLRGNVGTDTQEYLRFWYGLAPLYSYDSDYYSNFELGYKFVFSIIKIFSNSDITFLLFNALLALVPLYIGLKKILNDQVLISLIIYYSVFFIPYTLNGMRQAIAMGLFVFVLPYILSKKSIHVIFTAILASLFHSSGFLILVSYIFYIIAKKIKKWFYLFSFICALIFYKLGLGSIILFNYTSVNRDVYTIEFNESTSFFQIVIRTAIAFFIMFFAINLEKKNKLILNLFNVYWLGYLLYIVFADNNMISTRFNMFFRILEIVLVPLIISAYSIKFNKNSILVLFLIPCFIIFYYSSIFVDNMYEFFWE